MLGSRANREGTLPVPSPPLGWVFDGNFVVWDALWKILLVQQVGKLSYKWIRNLHCVSGCLRLHFLRLPHKTKFPSNIQEGTEKVYKVTALTKKCRYKSTGPRAVPYGSINFFSSSIKVLTSLNSRYTDANRTYATASRSFKCSITISPMRVLEISLSALSK